MLTFISTMSLLEFKQKLGADALEVHQNAKTDKYYFVCGSVRGAVSSKYIENKGKNPVVSLVEPDDGDAFYLLHDKDNETSSAVLSL